MQTPQPAPLSLLRESETTQRKRVWSICPCYPGPTHCVARAYILSVIPSLGRCGSGKKQKPSPATKKLYRVIRASHRAAQCGSCWSDRGESPSWMDFTDRRIRLDRPTTADQALFRKNQLQRLGNRPNMSSGMAALYPREGDIACCAIPGAIQPSCLLLGKRLSKQ